MHLPTSFSHLTSKPDSSLIGKQSCLLPLSSSVRLAGNLLPVIGAMPPTMDRDWCLWPYSRCHCRSLHSTEECLASVLSLRFQLPANVHFGRFLVHLDHADNRTELWAPGFSSPGPSCCEHFRSKLVHGRYLVSPCNFQINEFSKKKKIPSHWILYELHLKHICTTEYT